MGGIDGTNTTRDRRESRTERSGGTSSGGDRDGTSKVCDASRTASGASSGGAPVGESTSGGSSWGGEPDPEYRALTGGDAAQQASTQAPRASKFNVRSAAELRATDGWRRMESELERTDWSSLPDVRGSDVGETEIVTQCTTVELRRLLSNPQALRSSLARELRERFPRRSASEIRQKVDAIVGEAKEAFGSKVSSLISQRAEAMIDRAARLPEAIDESSASRRKFLAALARRAEGDRERIEGALVRLGIGGDAAGAIAETLERAQESGNLDRLADPSDDGPDRSLAPTGGAYGNAEEYLHDGLGEVLQNYETLRDQLGTRDMGLGDGTYANLTNPNFAKTRRAVLDQLEIGRIDDAYATARGAGAEEALVDYREKLVSNDTLGEKITAGAQVVSGMFAKASAEAGTFAMETYVAWRDKQLAEFSSEHAGTGGEDAGAEAWGDLAEMGTEKAVEFGVDFALSKVPVGSVADDAWKPATGGAREVALEHMRERASDHIEKELAEPAGDAMRREVERRVRNANVAR